MTDKKFIAEDKLNRLISVYLTQANTPMILKTVSWSPYNVKYDKDFIKSLPEHIQSQIQSLLQEINS